MYALVMHLQDVAGGRVEATGHAGAGSLDVGVCEEERNFHLWSTLNDHTPCTGHT